MPFRHADKSIANYTHDAPENDGLSPSVIVTLSPLGSITYCHSSQLSSHVYVRVEKQVEFAMYCGAGDLERVVYSLNLPARSIHH